MGSEQAPGSLVVVGASAGGIEALSTLLSTVPADFPAPIVVAQHLDPTRISALGAILARAGKLPVRTVEEQEPLQPGVVFVVPANRNVEIADHLVQVYVGGADRPKPSVDLLLTSAARTYGERLIAVILSGSGTDGAAGARDVKQRGGAVLIENPVTAKFPGMPAALLPTTVDIVANLPEIGPILNDLLTGKATPVPLPSDPALPAVLARVRDHSGVATDHHDLDILLRRLHRRLVACGVPTLTRYLVYLDAHPDETARLIASFIVRISELFRDQEVFERLRKVTLPALLAGADAGGRPLRVWVAGCATGEDAYSLAMLLVDLLPGQDAAEKVRLFATDLDAEAVAFARRAIYPASACAEAPPDLVSRYCTAVDPGFRVSQQVRQVIVFGQHDLARGAALPGIDLVFCRGVLSFSTPLVQRRALSLFAFALRDNGILVLGRTETTAADHDLFAPEEPTLAIYRRRPDRPVRPAAFAVGPAMALQSTTATPARAPELLRPAGLWLTTDPLLPLSVGVVQVNARYDVLALNPAAVRLLGLLYPPLGEDLLHALPAAVATTMRAVIDAAFGGDPLPLQPVEVLALPLEAPRYVLLHADRSLSDDAEDCVSVQVVDVTAIDDLRRQVERRLRALEQARQQDEVDRRRAEVEQAQLHERVRDLGRGNRLLLAANERLVAENLTLGQVLRANAVDADAAQAAIEQGQTLNEELQATAEELQVALQDLKAVQSDAEREALRYAAVLGQIADGVVVVDRNERVVFVNAAASRLWRQVHLGRRLDEQHGDDAFLDANGRPIPKEALPLFRALAGEKVEKAELTIVGVGARTIVEASAMPVVAPDGTPYGAVKTLHDVTAERAFLRQREEFFADIAHDLRTPLTAIRTLSGALLAQERTEFPAAVQEALRAIDRSSERMSRLVDDQLVLARLQAGEFHLDRDLCDLRDIARRAAQQIAPLLPERSQRMILNLPVRPVMGSVDAARLERALLNLLSNAHLHGRQQGRIELRLTVEAGDAIVAVADDGPGIPREGQATIFQRYGRSARRTDGSGGGGLGLAITRALVELHGGRIVLDSAPGAGATFRITLPLRTNGDDAERSRADESPRGG